MLILFRRRARASRQKAYGGDDGGGGGNALITGASSGIGEATALYLAERGFRVIATSRSAARLEPLVARAREGGLAGLSIVPVELDINSEEAVARAMPGVIARHGGIDALVNNAGFGLWGPVQTLSDAELKAQFETNFFAAARMTRAVLPSMLERRRGIIVNISSVLGRMATPFNGAYAASKFALEGMSESLKTELQPFGIRVALVEPGLFRTNFPNNASVAARADAGDPLYGALYGEHIERYRGNHDLFERFGGDPKRVARLVHKVIVSPDPPFRNAIGLDARAGILGARLLPQGVYWRLLRRATLG